MHFFLQPGSNSKAWCLFCPGGVQLAAHGLPKIANEGDLVVFDYKATIYGKEFKGNDGKNTQLELIDLKSKIFKNITTKKISKYSLINLIAFNSINSVFIALIKKIY